MTLTRDCLLAYLDDALDDAESARVEQALRDSPELRDELRRVIAERDRGEHSVGAIWRRERLTCPTRDQLGSFLLQVLEPDHQDYVEFHLSVIGCAFCQANLADLKQHQEPTRDRRRKRYYQSSAGFLPK